MKGEEVREILKRHGFNFAEIARKIGISPQLLNGWLSVDDIGLGKIEAIAEAINKGIEFFIPDLDIEKREKPFHPVEDFAYKPNENENLEKLLEVQEKYITLLEEKVKLLEVKKCESE